MCESSIIKYLMGWGGPSGFGSNSTAEDVTHQYHLPTSITAIITGATSGIGKETARVLAKSGARIILPARRYKAAQQAKVQILDECPEAEVILMDLDLSSLTSVRNFVTQFHALHLPLNLLINNAGMFSLQHQISEDGIEMTFATNYLGHFLLTKLLMKKMVETAKITGTEGRIVNVSSNYHNTFTGDMISYLHLITKDKSKYDPSRAYALSKLANILHTKELARRLKEMKGNVTVNSVHPGVVRTKLFRPQKPIIRFITDLIFLLLSKFLKTIPQGAATTCYVATNPKLEKVSGKYFEDCNEALPSKLGSDSNEARRLWAASEILTFKDNSNSKNQYA